MISIPLLPSTQPVCYSAYYPANQEALWLDQSGGTLDEGGNGGFWDLGNGKTETEKLERKNGNGKTGSEKREWKHGKTETEKRKQKNRNGKQKQSTVNGKTETQ